MLLAVNVVMFKSEAVDNVLSNAVIAACARSRDANFLCPWHQSRLFWAFLPGARRRMFDGTKIGDIIDPNSLARHNIT